jgi:outer membrane receptor protein involved in Fe transport
MAEEQSIELETMEVMASPIIEENRIDLFSDVSSIVTEDQLRDQNAVDLASALRRTPGVQITRFNPVGAFGGNEGGGVFIRGMGVSRPGSEIKTYVDGIPLYMGVWNHPLLDLLPINGMQSITIYKSPQPQINGNNFASVNLETKRATEEGIHGNGRISGGMLGTVIEQADISGRFGDIDFMLAQGYARSDGQRDNADGELKNVMGRLDWRLNENWSVGTSFLYTSNTSKDPGDSRLPAPAVAPEYSTEAGMVSLNLTHQHGDWHGDLRLYTNTGEGNWQYQPGLEGDTLTHFDMSGLRWKEAFSPWHGATMIAGVDSDWISGDVEFNRIEPAPRDRFDAPTFRVTSPYIALSQTFEINEDWSLVPSAGVRYYDHSEFDSEAAPHAGLSLVSERMTLFANISRGINYPGLEVATLSALIPPLGDSWRQLSAEQVDHGEVGAKFFPTDSTQIDVSFFNDRVKNRYLFGFPPLVPPPPQFINLGVYDMRGIEVAVKQDIGPNWSVFGGLTLLDPSIDNLPYTPDRAVTAGLNGQLEKVRLAFDAQYRSETWALNRARTADAANLEKVGSFVVVNARASYPIAALGKKGEVFVAVENLLDRDYSYQPGYPMPGIWGQFGLSASF